MVVVILIINYAQKCSLVPFCGSRPGSGAGQVDFTCMIYVEMGICWTAETRVAVFKHLSLLVGE